MTYTSPYGWGPQTTPAPLKWLLFTIGSFSLLAALLNPFFSDYLNIQSPIFVFGLSWQGFMGQHYFFEPLTYCLLQDGGNLGITFSFLLELFLKLYLLWVFGSSIIENIGTRPFLSFLATVSVFAGCTTLLLMYLLGFYTIIATSSGILLALAIIWTMLYPDSELLFFFLIPVKAKTLLIWVLGAVFLVTLSRLDPIVLFFYTVNCAAAYAYGILRWKLNGLFRWLKPFETRCKRLFEKFSSSPASQKSGPKIIDFNTGQPFLDDDAFVDAMLTKISQKGEQSLSWQERRRLKKISERKRGPHL